MTTSTQPSTTPRRRRLRLATVIVVLLAGLALLAALAVWVVFFSSPAPVAPSLDDALRVLLPSASPGG